MCYKQDPQPYVGHGQGQKDWCNTAYHYMSVGGHNDDGDNNNDNNNNNNNNNNY